MPSAAAQSFLYTQLTKDNRHNPSTQGQGSGGCVCAPSPAVAGDLQAQLIHEEPHDIITLSVQLQGSPVILRGPLGTGEGK